MSKRENRKTARRRVRRENKKSETKRDSMRAVRRCWGKGGAK